MRVLRLMLCVLLFAAATEAVAEPLRWQTLPPTPAPPAGSLPGTAEVDGIALHYATVGEGPPVVMLHSGLANGDWWGLQVAALRASHRVILVDSRGHGRSTRDRRPFGYDLMADDVVALMDKLAIPRADIVGWSDGAIIGLDLAIRRPERVNRVFSFAANSRPDGVKPDVDKDPTFASFIRRAGAEYRLMSATPDEYDAFVAQIGAMWAREPNWSDAQLRSIKAPVLIADGDHDEAIRRAHTEYLAATIPGAGLLIFPSTSHFAFLQDPALFNAALLDFLK